MRFALVCALFVFACPSFAAPERTQSDVVTRIISETRDHGQSHAILSEMLTKFGPRVTASPALAAAQSWAIRKLMSFGVDKATLDRYGEAPVSFQRGQHNHGGLIAPYTVDMALTTPAYTVGNTGAVAGKAIRNPTSLDEAKKQSKDLHGAWVLMPTPVGMRGPRLTTPTDVDVYVDSCNIAGRIYGTTSDKYVWTHGKWTDYAPGKRPKTPLISINHRDFGLVEYNIDKGKSPILQFHVDNNLQDRPTPLNNVIAEIRGSTTPSEVVIVCAHQDSWDGPGSQGAMDNGTGSALVLEVARVFGRLKLRPRRTVRFILWSGEEQGLLGSTAYATAHQSELLNIQAMINDDQGQNPYHLLNVPISLKQYFSDAFKGLEGAYPEFPVTLGLSDEFPNGGSDLGPFITKGVPGFALQKSDGPVLYTDIWHTQFDRFERVNSRMIEQNATYVATLAYRLADMEQRLPRIKLNTK